MRFLQLNRTIALLAGALGAGVLLAAPAQAQLVADNHTGGSEMGGEMQPEANPMGSEMSDSSAQTVVDIASSQDSFSTLVQAVQAAGLADTLSGEGPYTVFAPTNEAFNTLPDGALEFLLQPENRDLLQRVLTYHVVSGNVTSDQLSTGVVEALGGGLAVRVSNSGVVVNNASVVMADVEASNGVVHAVNRVLIPEPLQQQLASRLGIADIY
ncbi:fasciclin [filamentous cyanobacterium CCP5]|nr:fasciclin [filamentous cyanobacterium CCP5]